MDYTCNVMATLLSDSILAEQSLCTSTSRCSALLMAVSMAAGEVPLPCTRAMEQRAPVDETAAQV